MPSVIESISRCEFKLSLLGEHMVSSSKVIQLIDDQRVEQVWNSLLESEKDGVNTLT